MGHFMLRSVYDLVRRFAEMILTNFPTLFPDRALRSNWEKDPALLEI